jgi:hypothetical protein
MKSFLTAAGSLCLLTLLIAPLARLASAAPPVSPVPVAPPVARPSGPPEVSYPHQIRLRILEVTPVERIENTQILELKVERHYGKIDTRSFDRARKHETQRFSILFPAAPDATVKPGDLISYRLSDFTSIGR